jgi:hypothetical protein
MISPGGGPKPPPDHGLVAENAAIGRRSLSSIHDTNLSFQTHKSLLQEAILLVCFNSVDGKFLDLNQEFHLHVAETNAVFLDFCLRRDIRQVMVLSNERRHFVQWFQLVAGLEYLVRPPSVRHDHFLCADGSIDRQFVLRRTRSDAYIARSGDSHAFTKSTRVRCGERKVAGRRSGCVV